jgi:hypothetical protein
MHVHMHMRSFALHYLISGGMKLNFEMFSRSSHRIMQHNTSYIAIWCIQEAFTNVDSNVVLINAFIQEEMGQNALKLSFTRR